MGIRTCTSCGGQGSHVSYVTEDNFSPGSGPAFKTVEKRSMCTSCGGSGTILTYDSPSSYATPGVKKKVISHQSSDSTSSGNSSTNPSGGGTINTPSTDFIEEWFDRKFPYNKRRAYNYLFSGIGALLAYIMAPAEATGMYTIIGTAIGLFFIPILYYSAKLVYFAFIMLVGFGILYTVWKIISGLFT